MLAGGGGTSGGIESWPPAVALLMLLGVWYSVGWSDDKSGWLKAALVVAAQMSALREQCLDEGQTGRGGRRGEGEGEGEITGLGDRKKGGIMAVEGWGWHLRFCPVSVDGCDDAMSGVEGSGRGTLDRIVVNSGFATLTCNL